MATPEVITVAQLNRLVGTPDAPLVLDVRTDEDHAADPRALPASVLRDHQLSHLGRAGMPGDLLPSSAPTA
jgi:hypothetical protein